jgi:hypothetical protein
MNISSGRLGREPPDGWRGSGSGRSPALGRRGGERSPRTRARPASLAPGRPRDLGDMVPSIWTSTGPVARSSAGCQTRTSVSTKLIAAPTGRRGVGVRPRRGQPLGEQSVGHGHGGPDALDDRDAEGRLQRLHEIGEPAQPRTITSVSSASAARPSATTGRAGASSRRRLRSPGRRRADHAPVLHAESVDDAQAISRVRRGRVMDLQDMRAAVMGSDPRFRRQPRFNYP